MVQTQSNVKDKLSTLEIIMNNKDIGGQEMTDKILKCLLTGRIIRGLSLFTVGFIKLFLPAWAIGMIV